ncbi:hypothetical protein NQZ68_002593 [Dissostichus eleginoides]|nr:hypothetical protein NQZ68_002593 [Dissostichus eleginoides]
MNEEKAYYQKTDGSPIHSGPTGTPRDDSFHLRVTSAKKGLWDRILVSFPLSSPPPPPPIMPQLRLHLSPAMRPRPQLTHRQGEGGREGERLLMYKITVSRSKNGQSLNIDMWGILGLFCPTSNDHGLCPMTTRGPLMPPCFGPNSGMLLGRALGLMNSSASWRPWMEGQGPLGGGCGARGRERGGQPIKVLGMRKMEV